VVDGHHLENQKNCDISKDHLTDFDEIWFADACWLPRSYRPDKNQFEWQCQNFWL